MGKLPVSYQDILAARARFAGHVRATPLHYAANLSEERGVPLFLKAENLQRTGSFKVRGAFAKLMSLKPEQRAAGVVAASAGNHAQGVALAASVARISATIVMPEGAPITKLEATRALGARIVIHGATYDDAYQKALELQAEEGGVFIHAFEDPQVIAGQGTIGLEVMEALPDLGTILVPIGGGGLIAGIALAVKQRAPHVRVIGVQAAGAPAVYLSRQRGLHTGTETVRTIADGIAVKTPGVLNFELIRRYVDDVVLVDEDEIAQSILILLERCKLMAEGAGAVTLAALWSDKVQPGTGPVVAVVSGGNLDVNFLSRIIERGLVQAGRYVRVSALVPDRPGSLQRLLAAVAETGANVMEIHHERWLNQISISEVEVDLALETTNREHVRRLLEILRALGYRVREVPSHGDWPGSSGNPAPGGP